MLVKKLKKEFFTNTCFRIGLNTKINKIFFLLTPVLLEISSGGYWNGGVLSGGDIVLIPMSSPAINV